MKYLNMYSVWNLVAVLFAISIWGAESQERCQTPKKTQGQCIDMNACPTLYALLQSPQRKAEDIKFLRDSQCGFTGRIPKVCCEDDLPCTTPSGESGVCKKFASCASFISAIESFPANLPETVRKYILDSACQGVAQQSVCCGETVPDFSIAVQRVRRDGVTPAPSADLDEVFDVKKCGKSGSADRILGGTEAAIDQYPWLALMEYRASNGQIELLCGAVLIGPKYLLTAGHCVVGNILDAGKPESVRLGEHDINNPGEDCQVSAGDGKDCNKGHMSILIEEIVAHPGYQYGCKDKRDDIALVRLQKPAPRNDFISHICMPTVSQKFLQSDSLNLSVAGWGITESDERSNLKLFVVVPLKTLEQCQNAYRKAYAKENRRITITLSDKQMCAGGVAGKDACKGDSGGPLMYKNEESRYEVVGIVSFGPTPCGIPDLPGVYSKVTEYMDWIRSVVRR